MHTVTDAAPSLTADIGHRERRYLIQMGIRTLCLVLAVVVDHPVRWVFAVGAIVLPYFAVIFANGGREPSNVPDMSAFEAPESPQNEIPRHRREIGS
ncbi:DUF3099 domain-containing protein [Bailinhaonella thermotolerans]|uniref:DUF3099 domain-containing protein n=1 Tax=Bailinhaonella thermotolerans TaxID=1070861 RepID=UPI001F5BF75B|nr:DUF3099 domain-containing protein [Bailinhaonella thermotolerans]